MTYDLRPKTQAGHEQKWEHEQEQDRSRSGSIIRSRTGEEVGALTGAGQEQKFDPGERLFILLPKIIPLV